MELTSFNRDLLKDYESMDFWALSSLGFLDENCVHQLIQSGGSVNDLDRHGWTALMYACSFGQADAVDILLSAGADSKLLDPKGRSALINAVLNGETRLVGKLLKFSDLDLLDGFNRTALHYAVELDLEDILCCLVQGDASLDKPTDATPLMLAAERGNLNIVKYLVKSGADHQLSDRIGRNAECIARDNGHTEISKFLKLFSVSSIQEILNNLSLEKYLDVFEKRSITFKEFLNMAEDDFKTIGITLIGPRRKLSLALQELRLKK